MPHMVSPLKRVQGFEGSRVLEVSFKSLIKAPLFKPNRLKVLNLTP
jgi:hypothetical protein